MNLNQLGWSSFFSNHLTPQLSEYTIGRVAIEQKNTYLLYTELGEISAEVTGKMRYKSKDGLIFRRLEIGLLLVLSVVIKELFRRFCPERASFLAKQLAQLLTNKLLRPILIQCF